MERNKDYSLPEAVLVQDGPQVVASDGPQTVHKEEGLVLADVPEEKETHAKSEQATLPKKPSKKKLWLVLGGLLLAVGIIAVATGLSVWAKRRSSSNRDTPPKATTSSDAQPPVATPTHPTLAILNNSALTSVVTSAGDKWLFFQDNNGTLRRAHASNDSTQALNSQFSPWDFDIIDSKLVQGGAPAAKYGSPVTAFAHNVAHGNSGDKGDNGIYLFYVSMQDTLVGLVYNPAEGWSNIDTYNENAINISSFNVAPESTCLSVSVVPNTAYLEVLLLYEGRDSDIHVLHGTYSGPAVDPWDWQNATSDFLDSLVDIRSIKSPFTTLTDVGYDAQDNLLDGDQSDSMANLSVLISFNSITDQHSNPLIVHVAYVNGTFNEVESVPGFGPSHNTGDTDLVSFNPAGNIENLSMWQISNLSLVSIFGDVAGNIRPQTQFRFTRLAGLSLAGQEEFTFFFQTNETALSQLQYDARSGVWSSEGISATF